MKERILCSLKNISFVIIIALLGTACGDDKEESINVGNEGGNGTVTGTVAKVDVKKAGSLSSLIGDDVKFNITDLTVTGDINGDDIALIREMAGADVNGDETKGHLSKLNLKDANIVAGGNPYYIKSEIFVYYSKKNTISAYMFANCNKLISIIFPNNTEVVGEAVFSYYDSESETTKGNPNLTSVVMGDKITAIQSNAFAGTGIKDIKMPNTVTEIGNGAFNGCSNLVTANIPNSVTSIGYGVFSGCSNLVTINIPNSVTSIGSSVFKGCSNLTTIDIPDNLTNIGDETFNGCCKLTSINIPNGVIWIGDRAFADCELLKEIKIPDSVTGIGIGTFTNCRSLACLSIGSGLRYIGRITLIGNVNVWDDTFAGCNNLMNFSISEDNPNFASDEGMLLTKDKSRLVACPVAKAKVDIPNSVTMIGGLYSYYDTFYTYCLYALPFSFSHLTSVTIPAGVGYIFGFNYCTQLTEVHIRCTTPPALREAFIEVNDKCVFYVPRGTLDVYKKSEWWKSKNIVEE